MNERSVNRGFIDVNLFGWSLVLILINFLHGPPDGINIGALYRLICWAQEIVIRDTPTNKVVSHTLHCTTWKRVGSLKLESTNTRNTPHWTNFWIFLRRSETLPCLHYVLIDHKLSIHPSTAKSTRRFDDSLCCIQKRHSKMWTSTLLLISLIPCFQNNPVESVWYIIVGQKTRNSIYWNGFISWQLFENLPPIKS